MFGLHEHAFAILAELRKSQAESLNHQRKECTHLLKHPEREQQAISSVVSAFQAEEWPDISFIRKGFALSCNVAALASTYFDKLSTEAQLPQAERCCSGHAESG